MTMIRAIIQSVIEGTIKRVTAAGRSDETITDREAMEHYGFTSRPLAGAEAIIINNGNHFVMIAGDDRRYRIAIVEGEVCIYTDEGDHIRLKRNKEILISSGNKVTIEATNDVVINTINATINASAKADVNTPAATINASATALVKAPAVTIQGNTIGMAALGGGSASCTMTGNINMTGTLAVTGNISATGTILDGTGNTNHHTH